MSALCVLAVRVGFDKFLNNNIFLSLVWIAFRCVVSCRSVVCFVSCSRLLFHSGRSHSNIVVVLLVCRMCESLCEYLIAAYDSAHRLFTLFCCCCFFLDSFSFRVCIYVEYISWKQNSLFIPLVCIVIFQRKERDNDVGEWLYYEAYYH